ncbi:conserved hypothetical protein [Vibrio phage 489E54-1]|nr:conserved hypothetical protein [Vibrio phage 489E54-1]
MKNLKQREVMKALYLAKLTVSYAGKVFEQAAIHGFLGTHASVVAEDALKRRVNRFHRKQHPWCQGTWLVQPERIEVVAK